MDKTQRVIAAERAAEAFAREYQRAMAGDFRAGGPTESDDTRAERFWSKWTSFVTRSGFAGSGTTVYHDGNVAFQVERRANGRTFYGTDHVVSTTTVPGRNADGSPASA